MKTLFALLFCALAVTIRAQLNISPSGGGDGTITPKNSTEFFEDFLNVDTAWSMARGGESQPGNWDAIPGRAGVMRFTTSTGATNRSLLSIPNNAAILFSGGEATFETAVNVTTLSDGTETYSLRLGFLDSGTTDGTDGVFFRYTHSVNSGKWQLVARNNSVETATNSNSTVTAGAWTRLTIVVNSAGTSAEFFVDGTSIGTVASNIPITAGRETSVYINLTKSAGTTARTVFCDYVYVKKSYSTPR